eukprot:COSAG02_NODE_687_length_18478_cov_23.093476_3_plen_67_part_00
MCAQCCACLGWLACSEMRNFSHLQQTCAEIVKSEKSTVKMDKNEDSGEDGGSGVLAMCHKHDYTRG